MRSSTVLAAAAATSLLLLCSPSFGEGRDNPFVPPPSRSEEQARQDERVRNIVRELAPELEARVMKNVAQTQAEAEVRLRRRIDEASSKGSGAPAPLPGAGDAGPHGSPGARPGNAPSQAAPNPLEGAKFISCVNGKALYRDKDNALFQVSPGSGIQGADRCAR